MHRQFTVMHRDIELNRIDDMIIVIKPNRKISVQCFPLIDFTWLDLPGIFGDTFLFVLLLLSLTLFFYPPKIMKPSAID